MQTTSHAELCARIESLVQEHINAARQAATEALQRAFSTADSRLAQHKRHRAAVAYRSKDALGALQVAIQERLRNHPALRASELAAELGLDRKTLRGPLARMKALGLIRSVGQRNSTRYYPVAASDARMP